MKISEKTVKELGRIVTGDRGISPRRTGQNLVDLFNEFGLKDDYSQDFPSRWHYAEISIRKLNGTTELARLVESIFDPREFLNTQYNLESVLEDINQFLSYDHYQVVIANKRAKVLDMKGLVVDLTHPFSDSSVDSHRFIEDQILKCDSKIQSEDYYGAITNARSLLEAILKEIEHSLDENAPEYDGDLLRLYKRVSKLLKLSPDQKDLADTLKQILTGLTSIISGLAGLRNKMSDAHVASYKPSKHHAKLAVNAAKTIVEFLLETKQYQHLTKDK